MIFITVGHQMPFDRLVRTIDEWAAQTGRTDLFAQIGTGQYIPRQFPSAAYLTPAEFDDHMRRASAIIAHAGTGTIIAAMQLGKPLLVLPRLSARGETRNDHQVATARHFADSGCILAAYSEQELVSRMAELETFRPSQVIGGAASPGLIQAVREFIFGAASRRA